MLTGKLPWIVKKEIDFDAWFNRRILKWNDRKNLEWLLRNCRSHEAMEYVTRKFCLWLGSRVGEEKSPILDA
jgi:hypothetical protein